MTTRQALLCGILYWLAEANVPYVTVWTIQKPLMCGWITGIILGCPAAGAFCGAMLSLLYIGYRSQGSSMPADIALAGICASAAVCAAGGLHGFAAAAAIPAGFAGILVWRFRLHVNASFSSRTEKSIWEGRKWSILLPAVLQPVLFSAAVCIPVGAVFSFGIYSITNWLVTGAVSLSVLNTVDFAGKLLCAAGLPLSLFPMREKRAFPLFLLGLLIAFFTRAPLLLLAVPAFPAAGFLNPILKNKLRAGRVFPADRARTGKTSVSDIHPACSADNTSVNNIFADNVGSPDYFDPDLDEDWNPDSSDGFRDPDLDEGWNPDSSDGFRDPDLDEGWNPDSSDGSSCSDPHTIHAASDYGHHSSKKTSAGNLPSSFALTASNLLWILFVQAAYNTKQMMGQAATSAFLPVLEGLCPGRPADQQKILKRQCEYLNTQPEMGSALLGCLIRLEARSASTDGEDPDADHIRSVRSSLMGPIGGLGDELFQCGWIPLLLLIASDLVMRSNGAGTAWIPVYGIAATVSGAVLSGVCFAHGFSGTEILLLEMLESGLLHKIRDILHLVLFFLKGAALAACLFVFLLPA